MMMVTMMMIPRIYQKEIIISILMFMMEERLFMNVGKQYILSVLLIPHMGCVGCGGGGAAAHMRRNKQLEIRLGLHRKSRHFFEIFFQKSRPLIGKLGRSVFLIGESQKNLDGC